MADAMSPEGDNSAIEGALVQIETAVADIRAQLSQGKAEAVPTAPAGDMAGAGNPAAGKGGLEQFLGGK